jgi:molybdopterin/thiamine biosynthesis adenylyltransferase
MPIDTSALPKQDVKLSKEEILRYSRHLIMPEVGMDGQLKLKQAQVLLIGAGGLGAPLGLYLAAAGVGRLGIVDFDVVDFTNLQRQITFSTKDVGRKKAEAARERLSSMNPDIQIDTFDTRLTSENALDLFKDFDIIVDGTDNFPTRYSGERRLHPARQAERLRLYFSLRGASHGVRRAGRAVLSLPVSRTAAAGLGALVRGRRSSGSAAGHRRLAAGDGDD